MDKYVVVSETTTEAHAYGPITQLEANLLQDSIEEQGGIVNIYPLEHSPARYHTTQVAHADE